MIERISRRTLLSRIAAFVSAAALPGPACTSGRPAVRPDLIDVVNGRLRIVQGARVTEISLPMNGIASVINAKAEDLAHAGGFFARSSGPATTARSLPDRVRLERVDIAVEVLRSNGEIRFLDAQGNIRIAERGDVAPIAGLHATQTRGFAIETESALHGLGQFREPVFDYRGQDVLLAHANSDAVNPYLVSTAGWGLLWDTGTSAYLRQRGAGLELHSLGGDVVRYHVCIGNGLDALVRLYRALTGAAALLPKWAYGFWQSKERYASQAELGSVVDEYRKRGLPLDAIVLDWRYWGENGKFSGMSFDPALFPDPTAMTAHVHRQQVAVLASIWPAFGPETAIYRDMEAAGYLFPGEHWSGGRVFDASSASARALYWKYVKAGVIDHGFDGLWTDGNEPEFRSTAERWGTAAAFAANGNEAAGPIQANLLTYSWYQAKGLSEGLLRDVPGKRPVILSRSAYAGQQQFGTVTWSGDIFASWGTLTNQVIAAINMAASGMPHWSCDIGGFLVNHRYPKGLEDSAYKELYVRWFQFGAFLPVFRAHGTHVPRELWQFGEPGTPFYDALEHALRQRYALLPYVYAQAARVALDGDSFVRPLSAAYPNDTQARKQTTSYLFGDELLVRVVDRPYQYASTNIQELLPSRSVRGINEPAALIEYFEGSRFERKISQRLTDDIKLSWPGDIPSTLAGKPYSVRYRGRLIAQETGEHEFVVMGKGSIKLVLDGRVRVNETVAPAVADAANGAVSFKEHAGDGRYTFRAVLERGQGYRFELEQSQPVADVVSLWFEWITPSQRARMQLPDEAVVETYLPGGHDWYALQDGLRYHGGALVRTPALLRHMPVFVRAGAILAMTPGRDRSVGVLQSMTLRVHPGRDGSAMLYDDAGDGDGYRKGECARIPVTWEDATRTLRLGKREGSFPSMPNRITFAVEFPDGRAGPTVEYSGRPLDIAL
ncbi:TIM-barrel domain-containing protein [Xanthomonas hortorum]|uniref:TIM-barrel domain-containing protein n=1 Tax=Xanthomonas hortorum TaxID=56454 RepID=UPI001593B004|nr:TIM-barrel domain-containing protein [Xanthomonas hortorum]NHF67477.1 DUF5110 domain-containing protein [Xanthomonas hortorum]